jgi:hypothetical protein
MAAPPTGLAFFPHRPDHRPNSHPDRLRQSRPGLDHRPDFRRKANAFVSFEHPPTHVQTTRSEKPRRLQVPTGFEVPCVVLRFRNPVLYPLSYGRTRLQQAPGISASGRKNKTGPLLPIRQRLRDPP